MRTFASIYGNDELIDISLKKDVLEKLNNRIKLLKSYRTRPRLQNQRNKYRKKQTNKVEKKKKCIINELHWNVINYLTKTQDIIFFGDIKSHNIVKGNANRKLNRDMHDLRFFEFKQRLLYKCITNDKKVFFTNEAYTTQGCSSCGNLWKEIGSNKTYTCTKCKLVCDRDMNSAKNIYMKGIMTI